MSAFEPQVGPSDLDDIIAAVRQLQQGGGKLPSERDLAQHLS
ncbi:FadR family transcriptional regulator, partial [Mesorhizobium sp. M7A.F.Ca.CA.004.04.2.1]